MSVTSWGAPGQGMTGEHFSLGCGDCTCLNSGTGGKSPLEDKDPTSPCPFLLSLPHTFALWVDSGTVCPKHLEMCFMDVAQPFPQEVVPVVWPWQAMSDD